MRQRIKSWLRRQLIELLSDEAVPVIQPKRNTYTIQVEFRGEVYEYALAEFITNKLRQNWGGHLQNVRILR